MRSIPNAVYRLFHTDYPETFAAYSPQKTDFHDLVQFHLPKGWRIQRQGMWFYCSSPSNPLPLQGWKIHVSATLSNCQRILSQVASVLFRSKDTSFKFAVDRSFLSLLNSKSWPRGASGKFITIYPPDRDRFLEVIEAIHEATAEMQGPYILSDLAYKNSRVVFYRYGGIRAHAVLNVKGEKVAVLKTPEGSTMPDQRLPYPVIPPWETTAVPAENPDRSAKNVAALNGRYQIENAISFSSAGGVYLARDERTGKKVVVKEARPFIRVAMEDCDAIKLLKKEYRLLKRVADTGIAPQPIDLFQEWEHWFLVEEFIEGMPMSKHSAAHNIFSRTRPTEHEHREWLLVFTRLAENLMEIVNILHRRNIVFADLSTNNLIVTTDGRLRIIDFEGAHELGVDPVANIYTPGFGSRHRVSGGPPRKEDDYYSIGAVLLACLLPINGLLHLNPQARRELVSALQDDGRLPAGIAALINELMDQPETACVSYPNVATFVPGAPCESAVIAQRISPDYQATLNTVVTHLNCIADYARKDRLYPADPRVFSTNPLSLAYGAIGVIYALYKVTGKIPQEALDWILQNPVISTEYPPGLYLGASGIAWSLLEMGMEKPAEDIFQSTFQHPLLSQSMDLFYGMAGWGMTALRFFQCTGNEKYLELSQRAGNSLIASSTKSDRGYSWGSVECPVGLAHGSSGIALFLLYLHLVTRDKRYLMAGMRALDFDLAAATRTCDGGLSWGESVNSASPLYPYWRHGSAGIGIVTLRYQRLLRLPRYQSVLEDIFIDTDRKYAVFPGRFTGLAGLGEFLLDMHDFSEEPRYLASAYKVAEGIMLFRVQRNGTAFPGELLSRLCCDYGTGSAGIALFLNRLLGRQKNDFMLDELFASPQGRFVKKKNQANAGVCCA